MKRLIFEPLFLLLLSLVGCGMAKTAPPMAGACTYALADSYHGHDSSDRKQCIWRGKIWLCDIHVYPGLFMQDEWWCSAVGNAPVEIPKP